MTEARTLPALLAAQASRTPRAIAVEAPGREALDYAGLVAHARHVAAALAGHGVGRADRVAIVLDNGPEMASAVLGTAWCAVAAPLNPGYREPEFEFYLSDLRVRAVLVSRGSTSPAIAVARRLGATVLEIEVAPGSRAGEFSIASPPGPPQPEATATDTALVLHTSGTTSRPKIVPLTHENLVTSARNIGRTLRLTGADRCLNVMPLFHIHGLVGATLSTLASGGALVATPGFLAPQFFAWVRAFRPTWVTAVPTIWQAVLDRGASADLDGHALRLLRSSSASLPPTVCAGLEALFGIPVIESYGMTEAAHQMTSNPLPPGRRVVGSVGLPAGPEVAILDPSGGLLGPGSVGEVAIRGANVTPGYASNPEANRSAFTNGWFRTGDQGVIDEDGYLRLTGRLKELINRGGEKLSPREIDEAMLEHPAVLQAVAFAVPDERLGEEVGAAVVLRDGATLSARELHRHLAQRLADFKLPRHVAFVDVIPKGPTGKVQRIGLAERLGLPRPQVAAQAEDATALDATEAEVCALASEVLGISGLGPLDGFFDRGGDSMLGTHLLGEIARRFGVEVPGYVLFGAATLRDLASFVAGAAATGDPVSARVGVDAYPVTPFQEMSWIHGRLLRGAPTNRRLCLFLLDGPVVPDALEAALRAVQQRHPALRTRFVREGGRLLQRPDADPIRLERSAATTAESLDAFGARFARAPQTEPARACLLALGPERHALYVCVDHLVFDAWSAGILARELALAYEAVSRGSAWRPTPLPYTFADWCAWHREHADSPSTRERAAQWARTIGADLPTLDLPLDRPPPEPPTLRAGAATVALDPETVDAIATAARAHHTTPFVVLVALFAAELAAWCGQPTVVLGVPAAVRVPTATEDLIGQFLNHLVLRIDVPDDASLSGWIAAGTDAMRQARTYEDVPFPLLTRAARRPAAIGRNPVFQVAIQQKPAALAVHRAGEVSITEADVDDGITPFDLHLELNRHPDGMRCHLSFALDVFERATAARLLHRWHDRVRDAARTTRAASAAL